MGTGGQLFLRLLLGPFIVSPKLGGVLPDLKVEYSNISVLREEMLKG